jgi:hypothetical protein
MTTILVLLFLGAIAGIIKPYITGIRRKHFAITAVVLFVAIGLSAPEVDKTPATGKPDQPVAVAAKKPVPAKMLDHNGTINAFQSEVADAMKPCDKASQSLAEIAQRIAKGRATIYDGYSAASKTEEHCRDSWSSVSKLASPDSLPSAAKDKADETLDRCEGAMLAKQMAAAKMAEIFDGNLRPSAVQEAKELADGSQAGILACAAGFFLIADEAGVDIKQLKFGV